MIELDMMESIINTKLKYGISADIKTRFPNITFTTEVNTNPAVFPNVYLQELEPSEIANNLMNNEIGGMLSTMQLQVTTNTSKKDCKDVAYACVDVLKKCQYNITGLPLYSKTNDIHTYTIRVRRNICVGDTI